MKDKMVKYVKSVLMKALGWINMCGNTCVGLTVFIRGYVCLHIPDA